VEQQYTLRTGVFEGPLELLLALIEKRKLLINDIALAEVTDDYLKYLEQHPEFPVEETAQFVLVGSTLLLIKSKSLLPALTFSDEEVTSIEDLEIRLKQLQCFKRMGGVLQERYGKQQLFERRLVRVQEVKFSPDRMTSVQGLHAAIRATLTSLPTIKQSIPETTVRKVVSLEDMMVRLTERINTSMQVSFRDAIRDVGQKVDVIVTFLAILELVRQGVIRVEQETKHGDIRMHTDSINTPQYT